MQFGTHLYPMLYSFLLVAIVYHAFVTLFLDYSGSYEERARRWLPVSARCIGRSPSSLTREFRSTLWRKVCPGERSLPFFLKVPLILLMLISLIDACDVQALIAAICAVAMVIATPSGFYAGVAVESEGEQVLR